MIHIKNEKEIELMREAAEILKKCYKVIEEHIKPGITTAEIDRAVENVMKENKAIPAFKGVPCMYKGGKPFPACTCISINEEIIHGIPGSRVLKEGDIVCVDLGLYKNGYCSDAGRTYGVGEISEVGKKLIKVAKDAFFYAMDFARDGNRIGDISNAIQTYVEKNGFNLLREFQGHGIGEEMHEEPGVPNIGLPGKGPRLQKGMALAIEPMITEKSPEVEVLEDKWTVVTKDGGLSSYYENTIIITENEPEILTF